LASLGSHGGGCGQSLTMAFPYAANKTAIASPQRVPFIKCERPVPGQPRRSYEYPRGRRKSSLHGVSDCNMEKARCLRRNVPSAPRARGIRHRCRSRTGIPSASSSGARVRNRRQVDVIESGGKVLQDSRLYNANEGERTPCARTSSPTTTAISPNPTMLPLVVAPRGSPKSASSLPNS